MKTLIVAMCLALTGCGSTGPTAQVPVGVSCVEKKPARPEEKFGAGDYPGDKAAAQAALQDKNAWKGYAIELENIIAGCE